MNPSFHVCKKCLIMSSLPTNWCFGADPCYLVFQVNNINLDHLFFSTLVMFRWRQSKVYWNEDSAFMLFHVTQIIVALQHAKNKLLLVQRVFLWQNGQPLYFRLGNSQSRWIQVTDQNNGSIITGNAPTSARTISWGTDCLLLTKQGITETKSL